MTEHAKTPATYAELEALPPHLVGGILFSALVTRPRPSPRHRGAASALAAILTNADQFGVGGPGGWIFVVEPELHLGPHVAVPDIAGWRRERISALPDKAFVETPPDWIGDVISPSTEKYDKGDKRRIYAHYGVPHLWHVDPRAKMLEVFRLQERDWLLTHTFVDQEDVSAPPFAAITFSLGLLWPFDPPSTETPSDERR